jgi:hypothetical protein
MESANNDSIIWFSVPGGVQGFDLETVNKIIDEYNRNRLYKYGSFIDYFSYKMGVSIYHFSALWNISNNVTNKLHKIKGNNID